MSFDPYKEGRRLKAILTTVEEIVKHQKDLEDYAGYDHEYDREVIVHLNHRFFKTFFPNETDDFADEMEFCNYDEAKRRRLFGESLVYL